MSTGPAVARVNLGIDATTATHRPRTLTIATHAGGPVCTSSRLVLPLAIAVAELRNPPRRALLRARRTGHATQTRNTDIRARASCRARSVTGAAAAGPGCLVALPCADSCAARSGRSGVVAGRTRAIARAVTNMVRRGCARRVTCVRRRCRQSRACAGGDVASLTGSRTSLVAAVAVGAGRAGHAAGSYGQSGLSLLALAGPGRVACASAHAGA